MNNSRSGSKILPFRLAQPGAAPDDVAVKARDEFETSADPMWIFDLTSLAFLEVNQAAIRRYGYSRSDFLSRTILDIRPIEDTIPLIREELRDKKHNSDGEHWRHRACDGSVFDVEITSRELMYEGRRAEIVIAREIKDAENK